MSVERRRRISTPNLIVWRPLLQLVLLVACQLWERTRPFRPWAKLDVRPPKMILGIPLGGKLGPRPCKPKSCTSLAPSIGKLPPRKLRLRPKRNSLSHFGLIV